MLKKETTKDIAKIKRSNWPYFKKSSVCKFRAIRLEIIEEIEDAIEYIKLVIHYETLIDTLDLLPDLNKIEIKGWKRRLKKLQKRFENI